MSDKESTAEKALPDILIELGGKPRKLVLSLYGINLLEAEIERTSGKKSLWDGFNWKNLSSREVTKLIWASLVVDEPTLTEEEVSKWVTPIKALEIGAAFVHLAYELVSRAMPIAEALSDDSRLEELQKKILKSSEPTGSASSPSQPSS